MNVPIEISARHIHLCQRDFEALFGAGAVLTPRNPLSQPGTFAAQEAVTLKTEKAEIANVRILGPLRDYTQIEVSKGDAYRLGIDPPIRDTHELELEGTSGIGITGSIGRITLEIGVIIPWRHIHMSPNDALEAGVGDGDLVKIDINSDARSVVFENVLIRVAPNYKLAMHIDTDEANAAGIEGGEVGKLIAK